MYPFIYTTGISTNLLNAVYAPQKKDYWCWSASITMILNAYGIQNVSQTSFARDVCGIDEYGRACNCGATDLDISRSLNLNGRDQHGRQFQVKAPLYTSTPSLTRIFNELENQRPVLVAYRYAGMPMKHAVIITGAEYHIQNNTKYISKLIIRDPDPDIWNQMNDGRKEITDVTGFLNSVKAHWYIHINKTPL